MADDNNVNEERRESRAQYGSPKAEADRKEVIEHATEALKKADSILLITTEPSGVRLISMVGACYGSPGDGVKILQAFKEWAEGFHKAYMKAQEEHEGEGDHDNG